jgi:adenylate cyclase 5
MLKDTISTVYIFLVSGLTSQTSDPVNFTHLTAMADFAFRLKEQLVYVNEHSFNNFQIRAGQSVV